MSRRNLNCLMAKSTPPCFLASSVAGSGEFESIPSGCRFLKCFDSGKDVMTVSVKPSCAGAVRFSWRRSKAWGRCLVARRRAFGMLCGNRQLAPLSGTEPVRSSKRWCHEFTGTGFLGCFLHSEVRPEVSPDLASGLQSHPVFESALNCLVACCR